MSCWGVRSYKVRRRRLRCTRSWNRKTWQTSKPLHMFSSGYSSQPWMNCITSPPLGFLFSRPFTRSALTAIPSRSSLSACRTTRNTCKGNGGRDFHTEPLSLQPTLLHQFDTSLTVDTCGSPMELSCCSNHVSTTDEGVATILNVIKRCQTPVTSICQVLKEAFLRSERPWRECSKILPHFLGKVPEVGHTNVTTPAGFHKLYLIMRDVSGIKC